MYRYLFEENCFSRTFGSSKNINLDLIKKIREIIAKNLEIKYEDVELNHYEKSQEGVEVKIEVIKEITKNFVFRVVVKVSEKGNSIISLDTFISRVVPIHLVGFPYVEDIVYNMMEELARKTFYKDFMNEMKLKYEELSKRIYEDLEALFGLDITELLDNKDNGKQLS
jgi:hypothetical protein